MTKAQENARKLNRMACNLTEMIVLVLPVLLTIGLLVACLFAFKR